MSVRSPRRRFFHSESFPRSARLLCFTVCVSLAPVACLQPQDSCLDEALLDIAGGLAPPSPSAVDVTLTQEEGRASFRLLDSDDGEHNVSFSSGENVFDEPRGALVGSFGTALGEAPDVIYVVLRDDAGLWFEGGRSLVFDGERSGGAELPGRITHGSQTTANCADPRGEPATLLGVVVSMDNGANTVTDRPEQGTIDGVSVMAVGVGAYSRDFGTATETVGYIFRVQ